MRGESDHDGRAGERGKLLFHLGRVPMGGDAVRLDVLVGLGVEVHGVDPPPLGPCPRHARLAVDHDALGAPQPALEQRRRREYRAHGVTAGIGHEGGAGDGLAVELGQSVHGFAQPGGVDVIRLVPGRIECAVAQPVVGREVDDLAAELPEHGHRALGFHVRQREEDEVGLVAETRGVELGEDQIRETAQVREDPVEPLAGEPLGRHGHQLELGMDAEQSEGLRPHVAARSRHRHAQHGPTAWSTGTSTARPAGRTSCALSCAGRA